MCCISDEHGSLVDDSEFPKVLFLMHKWFMTSEELGKQFKVLYPFFKNKEKKKNQFDKFNMLLNIDIVWYFKVFFEIICIILLHINMYSF